MSKLAHLASFRWPSHDSMDAALVIRNLLAVVIALGLAVSGYKKKSLSLSGSIAAVLVGYASFACSYRFGLILILFYYSSSKLTKWKQDFKAKIEEDYAVGGQRNWIQVLASSFLATLAALAFYYYCGEDQHISFGAPANPANVLTIGQFTVHKSTLATYLWAVYLAHYCTANADTWASELGVLSTHDPRLVTTLFTRVVPRGTNGGMSLFGTAASGAGGAFIGAIFWLFSYLPSLQGNGQQAAAQYPVLIYSLLCGLLGSLVDSVLGATVQATYYSKERKCIVKHTSPAERTASKDKSIVRICGADILSNEAVNFLSIFLTMVLSVWLAPNVYCWVDSQQCFEAHRLNAAILSVFHRAA